MASEPLKPKPKTLVAGKTKINNCIARVFIRNNKDEYKRQIFILRKKANWLIKHKNVGRLKGQPKSCERKTD